MTEISLVFPYGGITRIRFWVEVHASSQPAKAPLLYLIFRSERPEHLQYSTCFRICQVKSQIFHT